MPVPKTDKLALVLEETRERLYTGTDGLLAPHFGQY